MAYFTTKQNTLFYCYTPPVRQLEKINEFLSVLETSGVAEIIKKVINPKDYGRPGLDPYAMFATIIYGFAVGVATLRDLESSCIFDIRFQYLMNGVTPNYSSFSKFINAVIKPKSDEIFACLVKAYLQRCKLTVDDCHIDGTKFQARSNKYKVVWKPRTFHEKLSDKIRSLLNEMDLIGDIPNAGIIPSGMIAGKLSELALRKKPDQQGDEAKLLDQKISELTTFLSKALEYEEKERICGDHRNSYYKTDHDATAMCLKEDYYSGLGSNLHPAYQVQAVVSNGFVVAFYVSQDRNDMHALVPTLRRFYDIFQAYPKRLTADAGYGCWENYDFCNQNGIEAYIKYTAWSGESSGRRPARYELTDDGTITCMAERIGHAVEIPGRHHQIKNGKFYEVRCRNLCPFKMYCRNPLKNKKGRSRIFEINPDYQKLRQQARDRLLSPKGIEMRINRSCQVEGVYGITKYDMGYNRIRRVGMNRVKTEIMLTAIGLNTRKLFRFFEGKDSFTYWRAPPDLAPEHFKKPSAKRLENRILAKKRPKQPNQIARESYRRKWRK